ncbi:MAG: ribulokinase, partial [Candidatus Firestonebacteria bacterium RIFOXYA2_FULL_40_8]
HTIRKDSAILKTAASWVEHADWVPALLTGVNNVSQIKRSRCAAGHKAMWNESWGGLPSEEFLVKLDPKLKGLRGKLYEKTFVCDEKAGYLSFAWAKKFGLSTEVSVGTGSFDAHIGAVGACITPYALVRIMGTSTCDILTAPKKDVKNKVIKGICGQVDGSVIPGFIGMEAGQSAFGDIYAWFRDVLTGPLKGFLEASSAKGSNKNEFLEAYKKSIIPYLSKEAAKIPPSESALIALDWMNGRRTPFANQMLKGAVTGITLGTSAPRIFRALVEGTAFGSRKIVERFKAEGVKVDSIIAIGGVSKKSPFVMQVLSDVLKMPIKVAASEQCCALGAAMCASVVARVYKNLDEAKRNMGGGFDATYRPNKKNSLIYDKLYKEYCTLGDFIEKNTRG